MGLGGVTNVNTFASVSDPPVVVTTTIAEPALPAGVVTVIDVSLTTVSDVPAVPPNVTPVAPVNFKPVIVTTVPPTVEPEVGEIVETDGAAAVGVIDVLADDGAESAVTFRAITVNVYEVPFASPDTEQDVPEVVHVNPPGFEVTT